MADYIDVGGRIAVLRKERGITQEKLVELIGEEKLSLSTLKRIENGKSKIDFERAFYICKALGCNSHDLIKDTDDKREAIKAVYQEDRELDEDDFWNIEDSIMRLSLCYPQVPSDKLYERFTITNLMQFIIYLPLIDPANLYYSLLKIDGDAFNREFYVLSQLEYLYSKIPESSAKEYADLMAARCNADYFMEYHTSLGMTEMDKKWTDPECWAELSRLHQAYMDSIEKRRP